MNRYPHLESAKKSPLWTFLYGNIINLKYLNHQIRMTGMPIATRQLGTLNSVIEFGEKESKKLYNERETYIKNAITASIVYKGDGFSPQTKAIGKQDADVLHKKIQSITDEYLYVSYYVEKWKDQLDVVKQSLARFQRDLERREDRIFIESFVIFQSFEQNRLLQPPSEFAPFDEYGIVPHDYRVPQVQSSGQGSSKLSQMVQSGLGLLNIKTKQEKEQRERCIRIALKNTKFSQTEIEKIVDKAIAHCKQAIKKAEKQRKK